MAFPLTNKPTFVEDEPVLMAKILYSISSTPFQFELMIRYYHIFMRWQTQYMKLKDIKNQKYFTLRIVLLLM